MLNSIEEKAHTQKSQCGCTAYDKVNLSYYTYVFHGEYVRLHILYLDMLNTFCNEGNAKSCKAA